MKHSVEYQNFTNLVEHLLTVPHEEIQRRETEYRKRVEENPKRRGPKRGSKRKPKAAMPPSASDPLAHVEPGGAMMNVASVNSAFPKYPMTVHDKGWVYGVWYCGTSWDRVRLHGQYPPTFLKRALALFPDAKEILHCPCGTVTGPGVTVDMIEDDVRKPQIKAAADALPFADGTFDLYLSDPPYTNADSAKYGCPPYPLGKAMKEAHRILRVGGHFGILHTYYPRYRRKLWKLGGLIAVVTGFQRATRMFSIFEKLGA